MNDFLMQMSAVFNAKPFVQRLHPQITVSCCSYARRAYDWHVLLVLKSHKRSLKNPDSFPSCNILYMIPIIPRQCLIDGQIIRSKNN